MSKPLSTTVQVDEQRQHKPQTNHDYQRALVKLLRFSQWAQKALLLFCFQADSAGFLPS